MLMIRLAYLGLFLLVSSALYAGYAFHMGDETVRAWITPLCMLTGAAAILIGHRRRMTDRSTIS